MDSRIVIFPFYNPFFLFLGNFSQMLYILTYSINITYSHTFWQYPIAKCLYQQLRSRIYVYSFFLTKVIIPIIFIIDI